MRGSSGGVLMEFGTTEVPSPPSSVPTPPLPSKAKMTTTNDAASVPSASSTAAKRDGDTSRLRSVDSASSLSSTVYEDDNECSVGVPASSSSATAPAVVSAATGAGGFEPSKFFRFTDFGARSNGDFFSAASPEFGDDTVDNNEILPPRTVSPTNQTTHDVAVASAGSSIASASAVVSTSGTDSSAVPPPLPLGSRGVSLPSRGVLAGGRRKNSIEMFLSQSPSQALGGGFLKMALDDDHVPPTPPAHRLPPRRHDAVTTGGVGASSVVTISQSTRPIELDARDADRSLVKEPVGAGIGGAPPTAATSSYGYLLSHSPPAVDTDDEWSSTSSQEMLGGGANSSSAAYYYAESQAALHHQSHHAPQQQAAYAYSSAGASSNYRYGANDNYNSNAGVRPQSVQHQNASWATSAPSSGTASSYGAPAQSPYAMQSSMNSSVSSGFSQYHQQHQQHQYQQQQQPPQQVYHQHPPHGHRTTVHQRGYGRSQSMYASSSSSGRMMMMESSPPPSPHTTVSGHYSVKQCKFFLQGHCRMGNKCKFAHHQSQHHASSSSYHHQPQPQPQLHQSQSFHVPHASPATSPHHLQHHAPLHGGHEYDTYATSSTSSTPSSYIPRGGSSRSSYRPGGAEMHHHSSSASLTMAPHPSAHHALGGMPGSSLAMSTNAAQVAPVDAMLKVEDVQGRVFSMSKDQNGCRLLQEQLEYYDERKTLCDMIYAEAMDHLAEMMVDPFGNYLFQKLLERAKPLQRLEIVRRVSGHLVAAALNLHGTRSVQKVVEVCATSAQVVELASDGSELRRVNLPDLIVEALKDDAVRLCIDSNGNHVIQRALQFMKPEYNQFVFDAVCKECTTVGTHRHGCCVLQRCLDAANDQQKREVITQVEKQAMKLMQDPYGNYVVQYVLDSCTAEEAYGVIVKPLGNVFELSVQKFSSNVIEKCLEKAPPSVLKEYVDEITHCPKMQKMLQDQFANYVVQRALSVSAEDQCLALVKSIRPHLPAMKNTSGGRRITARILKRFPHMDLNLDLGFEPAALGASYAMGGMSMQGYAAPQHHAHHHHQPSQHYDPSYSMPFASASSTGSLGLGLHGGASMMNNGAGGGRM